MSPRDITPILFIFLLLIKLETSNEHIGPPSKQNAANIEFLKQQFDGINGIQTEVNDLSGNVAALQTQVDGLVQGQQDYTSNVTSSNSELSTSYDDSDTSNTTMPDTTTST